MDTAAESRPSLAGWGGGGGGLSPAATLYQPGAVLFRPPPLPPVPAPAAHDHTCIIIRAIRSSSFGLSLCCSTIRASRPATVL